jgi:hypothetical protein
LSGTLRGAGENAVVMIVGVAYICFDLRRMFRQ